MSRSRPAGAEAKPDRTDAADPPRPRPATRLSGVSAYRPSPGRPDVLRLHANEGRAPELDFAAIFEGFDPARYPSQGALEAELAAQHGVDPDRVVVTAGADDALARIALATLEPGRRAVLLDPTFEMIPRYVRLSGAGAVPVPWLDAPFPEAAFFEALGAKDVAAGFVVSPSSPAGEVAPLSALLRLADRARALGRLFVVDLAYAEFADEDPGPALIERGDVVITRTLSKAIGLAGLRVGYAIAPPEVADWLRAAGQPFAVSAPSLAIAAHVLPRRAEVAEAARVRTRSERERLYAHLETLGAGPIRSQANFVLARLGERGPAVAAALELAGYRVRVISFPGLEGSVRITCPQDEASFEGLLSALTLALDGTEATHR